MKVYYFSPDSEFNVFWGDLSSDDVKELAQKNGDYVTIYNSLKYFEEAFNQGYISDEGYIFFVEG